MLAKMGGIFAPKPAAGPHKSRECLPLSIILRNRLKYALTRKESLMIVMQKSVKVDGKVRTELNFPAGFMDVIQLEGTDDAFRLMYDTKGRFVLHKIGGEEAKYKLGRVVSYSCPCSVSQLSRCAVSHAYAPVHWLTFIHHLFLPAAGQRWHLLQERAIHRDPRWPHHPLP